MKKYQRICYCAAPRPNRRAVQVNRDACKCGKCNGLLTAQHAVATGVS